MAIIKCPECGHQVSSLAETCPSCGVSIAGNILKCPECGGVMLRAQDICPNCYHVMHSDATGDDVAQENNVEKTDAVQTAEIVADEAKSHVWLTILLVAFVLSLLLVFVGYYFYRHTQQQNEDAAYVNAIRSTEPAVLQNFLDMYQDASQERKDTIASHLALLKKIDTDWQNTLQHKTRASLVTYTKLHPGSIHNIEANLMIDTIDWEKANEERSLASYRKYIEEHSNGEFIDYAKARYDSIENDTTSRVDVQTEGW